MPDADANADSERMQILLRRFEIPLLQFATRITGDRERARDVVQETFVKFQNNGAFQNPEPATWLFTVCRNGALKVGRKERRMQYLDEKMIDAGEIDAGQTVTAFYEVVAAEASASAAAMITPLASRQF